ncbi:vitrin-like [Physella acuta]|uniref:vitrin-like n=1 Tax=Physella acuta TaxID=109671 RepID=UPI0027DE6781|nr:vitrin-like [Physella acuta]
MFSLNVCNAEGHNKTIRNTKHCKGKVDVIFVLDSSSSVRADGWTKELEFVSDVVKHFTVGPDHVQVGAVAFSYLGELLFNLKDHKSVAGIEKALKSARFIDSQSNIDKALNVINSKKMFSKEHGGRPGVPKIVFIISDGPSTDLPKSEFKVMRGCDLHVVGGSLKVVRF